MNFQKKIITLLIGLFCFSAVAKAEIEPISKAPTGALAHPSAPTAAQTAAISQNPQVEFSQCNKNFKIDGEKLFYLSLSAINANRFSVTEIQSQSGYILFTAGQKQFLASVMKISNNESLLKITPCDNIYNFQIGIVQNIFKYIELNLNTPIEKLGVM